MQNLPHPHQSLAKKSRLRWVWVYVATYVWCLNWLLYLSVIFVQRDPRLFCTDRIHIFSVISAQAMKDFQKNFYFANTISNSTPSATMAEKSSEKVGCAHYQRKCALIVSYQAKTVKTFEDYHIDYFSGSTTLILSEEFALFHGFSIIAHSTW